MHIFPVRGNADRTFRRALPSVICAALALQLLWATGFPGHSRDVATADPVQSSWQLPAGLILPVSLDKAVSVKEAEKGHAVEARIMQDVPLSDHGRIPMRAQVKGTILNVAKDTDGPGVTLTLSFTQVQDRDQNRSMLTGLRSIATFEVVRAAITPFTGAETGSPTGWATTVQIGGDIRYGVGGPVRSKQKERVGKGVPGGVLVYVRANAQYGCEGPIKGDDHLQALWVFSADACGYYGFKDFEIAHNGMSDPLGEISLHFAKDNAKLDSGTGMLLRVVARP
jgi:hypothetical protein